LHNSAYTSPQSVAPGFATFCRRYRYGKTSYACETLYEIRDEDLLMPPFAYVQTPPPSKLHKSEIQHQR